MVKSTYILLFMKNIYIRAFDFGNVRIGHSQLKKISLLEQLSILEIFRMANLFRKTRKAVLLLNNQDGTLICHRKVFSDVIYDFMKIDDLFFMIFIISKCFRLISRRIKLLLVHSMTFCLCITCFFFEYGFNICVI